VQEDSRVGGVSAIDLVASARTPQNAKDQTKKKAMKHVEPVTKEEQADWTEAEKADQSGVDQNATGYEGGNVGEEENVPAAELETETQLAEMNAPEEAEAEAQPEDCETAGQDEGIQQAEATE
jgi:hypothetical protein